MVYKYVNVCCKCKNNKVSNSQQYKRNIQKYGSKEDLISKYVCKSCKNV